MKKLTIEIESDNPGILQRVRDMLSPENNARLEVAPISATTYYTRVEVRDEDGNSVWLTIIYPNGMGTPGS